MGIVSGRNWPSPRRYAGKERRRSAGTRIPCRKSTSSFQYPSTRPATYHVAGELVRRGADLAKICDEVYQSYPLSRVRLLKHLYSHFRLTHHDRIAYYWLKKADFVRTGADSSDSEG